MKVQDNCLDSQLWHACAGGMVQMPSVNAKVYYFPQGHAEHAQGNVDFGGCPRSPGMILCRVVAIKFMADRDTDEVFAKMHLVPVRPNEADYSKDDGDRLGCNGSDVLEKPASFAKTLTQSDANNGGGFSVPRYCAETIFPRLDYSASPPVQTVLARDVHGEIWKFRHIYRGTPRRHLLTTGWSTFVDRKKLVAGDSVVFLRAANGDLCIGIRRAKRGIGSGLESPSGWNLPSGNCLDRYGGFSVFMREEECKLMRNNGAGGNVNASSGITGRGKVGAESVIEAATLAANGQPFEVVYYPRASTPEFCVKASSVREATRIPWASGMRFKMAFETEDSSRISWFMGTISAVQVADPMRWPNSPWRILQVTWDEPDLLQNVKNVSPWLAELVSNIPAIHMTPFSSPRKKMRLPQHPEFPFIGQVPTPMFPPYPIWPSSSPLCYPPDGTPAGIQGARHAQFDIPLLDLHLNKLQSSLFPSGTHPINHGASPVSDENISCLLTTGSPSHSMKEASGAKAPTFMLFGQPILTEEQLSLSSSRGTVSAVLTGNSSSGGNTEKSTTNLSSDGSGSAIHQVGPSDISSCDGSPRSELGLETGHCKVFMESEDVGRTLDLSALGSYEELYRMLGNLFEIEKSDVMNHVLYRDSAGAMRHTGDEPFSDFSKTVRKLTILMDSGSNNTRR